MRFKRIEFLVIFVTVIVMLILTACNNIDMPEETPLQTSLLTSEPMLPQPAPTPSPSPQPSPTPAPPKPPLPTPNLNPTPSPSPTILPPRQIRYLSYNQYSVRWHARPEYDIVVDNILFYCGNTYTSYTRRTGYSGDRDTGLMWVDSTTGEVSERLPDNTSPAIVRALEEGYPDRWNYSTYSGDYDFEDCRSYLILFLYNLKGLTASGSIEFDFADYIAHVDAEGWAPFKYKFLVRINNSPNGEELIFYIAEWDLSVYDQNGNVLNPDGWLWPLPERILTQQETEDRLWALGGAARGYEYDPDLDVVVGGVKYYGYNMHAYVESSGEYEKSYIWVSTTTGEWVTSKDPTFP